MFWIFFARQLFGLLFPKIGQNLFFSHTDFGEKFERKKLELGQIVKRNVGKCLHGHKPFLIGH
jgi:hypothetical protein